MSDYTEVVPVKLDDGTVIHAEARLLHGEVQVSDKFFNLDDVMNVIKGIASTLHSTIATIKPDKATVEFGVELALESGQLTALIVKGEAKGNLKITLEWGQAGSKQQG